MAAYAFQPDNIPPELRDRDQWVCWRTRARGRHRTKVPCMPNLTAASSTDPSTWTTFGAVVEAVNLAIPVVDGIGFVLTDDDPYVGIDMDRCRTPKGELHPDAARTVDELASYTEISPSGGGIRIIVRAAKPGSRCSVPRMPWGAECAIYDSGRFLTLTGDVLGDATIGDRQEQLAALYERLFPVKPRQAVIEREADERAALLRQMEEGS
jgi:putative DNA primase/helicase